MKYKKVLSDRKGRTVRGVVSPPVSGGGIGGEGGEGRESTPVRPLARGSGGRGGGTSGLQLGEGGRDTLRSCQGVYLSLPLLPYW